MDLYKILEHNDEIDRKVKVLTQEIKELNKSKVAPCMYCPYKRINKFMSFRCMMCGSNYYNGFNIKNYPSA